MRKYNIIQIFQKMDYGGAELRTIDLFKSLDKTKYKFYFCSLSGETGELDDAIREMGGEVIYCKLKSPFFPYKFIKILIENKINVVHSHVYYFSGVILLLSKIAKVNIRIAHFRTSNSGKTTSFINRIKYSLFKKMIFKYSTNILGVSRTSIEDSLGVEAFKDERVEVIYNGLDLEKLNEIKKNGIPIKEDLRIQYNIDEKELLFIHVGRMNVAKNHMKLVEVFNQYLKEEGNAKLFLVGKENPSIKKLLEDKIEEYGISEEVYYLGVQSNVYTFLSQSDIMVFPSTREGLPGVVLEATAAGIPVVASDIKPNKELAQYFESIKCISNSKRDSIWVKEIKKTLINKTDQSFMYNEFLESPFLIKINRDKYQSILARKYKENAREEYE